MIAQTIEEMNLRPVNVLFIDDNPQNLEEAKFFNPGLQTATPEVLGELLSWPACQGKPDPGLSRLKQYRQLEQKVIDQQQFTTGSNEDFLRQCQIRVRIEHDCSAQFDRLLEMIQRTNQLEFHQAAARRRQPAANPGRSAVRLRLRASCRPLRRLWHRRLLRAGRRPARALPVFLPHPEHGGRILALRSTGPAAARHGG